MEINRIGVECNGMKRSGSSLGFGTAIRISGTPAKTSNQEPVVTTYGAALHTQTQLQPRIAYPDSRDVGRHGAGLLPILGLSNVWGVPEHYVLPSSYPRGCHRHSNTFFCCPGRSEPPRRIRHRDRRRSGSGQRTHGDGLCSRWSGLGDGPHGPTLAHRHQHARRTIGRLGGNGSQR